MGYFDNFSDRDVFFIGAILFGIGGLFMWIAAIKIVHYDMLFFIVGAISFIAGIFDMNVGLSRMYKKLGISCQH
jgi:hypothetical protein